MDSYLQNILRFNEQLTPIGLRSEHLDHLRTAPARRSLGEGGNCDALVICGMGGSALAGDIVKGVADELGLRVPVIVHKDYGLPKISSAHKRPLFIFISFSGGTEETLSGLKKLLQPATRNLQPHIAIIATGGELLRIARAKKLATITFSAGSLTPRQATGRMFYAISELLFASRLITKRPPAYVSLRSADWKSKGSALARRLKGKLIVIYSETNDRYLGYLWKIKLNETAKVPAFSNVIPEMNHNELVGFEKKAFPTAALVLREPTTAGQLKKRITIDIRVLAAHDVTPIQIPLTGKTRLERTWQTIMFGDWTSYALAKLRAVDPRETAIIDKLKAALAK